MEYSEYFYEFLKTKGFQKLLVGNSYYYHLKIRDDLGITVNVDAKDLFLVGLDSSYQLSNVALIRNWDIDEFTFAGTISSVIDQLTDLK